MIFVLMKHSTVPCTVYNRPSNVVKLAAWLTLVLWGPGWTMSCALQSSDSVGRASSGSSLYL